MRRILPTRWVWHQIPSNCIVKTSATNRGSGIPASIFTTPSTRCPNRTAPVQPGFPKKGGIFPSFSPAFSRLKLSQAKIGSIQDTTEVTVEQITEITTVITNVNEVVANIATAVEEQSAATKDIAGNVAQASQGIQEVNENVNQGSSVSAEISSDIAGVSVSMNEMSTSSSQVNLSAQELSRLSESLKQMVEQFKV